MPIRIGTKVISHDRYVTIQMAEVVISRKMFADILMVITQLRVPPALAWGALGPKGAGRSWTKRVFMKATDRIPALHAEATLGFLAKPAIRGRTMLQGGPEEGQNRDANMAMWKYRDSRAAILEKE